MHQFHRNLKNQVCRKEIVLICRRKTSSLVKRERKPLTIVDPTSQKAVELPNVPPPTNTSSTNSNKSTTDSANTSASNSESEKTRAAFRQKVAQLAHSGTANSKVTVCTIAT